MDTFLKKCLFFIAPLFLSLIVFGLMYHVKLSAVDEKMRDISQYYTVLIMGDSVMQRISPTLFKKSTYNFASSAEHYYFTYSKLKKLLSFSKSNVGYVILGMSIHNFAPVYQKLFNLRYSEGEKSLKHYLYFIDFETNRFFDFKEIVFNKSLYKAVARDPYWGGFKESNHKNPGAGIIQRVLKMHYDGEGLLNPMDSFEQKYYIEQIIHLCREKHVQLLLVSTPVLKDYQNQTDCGYFDILADVIKEHSDINYLNFLDVNISSEYMSDANHLNKAGAAIYSEIIAHVVEQKIEGG